MTCVAGYSYSFSQTRTGLILQDVKKHKFLNVSYHKFKFYVEDLF